MQPNCIYQSEASLTSLEPIGCNFNFGVNGPLWNVYDMILIWNNPMSICVASEADIKSTVFSMIKLFFFVFF